MQSHFPLSFKYHFPIIYIILPYIQKVFFLTLLLIKFPAFQGTTQTQPSTRNLRENLSIVISVCDMIDSLLLLVNIWHLTTVIIAIGL